MHLTETEFAQLQATRQTPTVCAQKPVSERQSEACTSDAPDSPESEIQANILQFLRFKGIPHTRSAAELSKNAEGKRVQRLKPGWPDITGCYQGRMLAIEVKAPKGKLRIKQAEVLHALWLEGAIVVIARSIDDVQHALAHGTSEATKREITQTLTGTTGAVVSTQ